MFVWECGFTFIGLTNFILNLVLPPSAWNPGMCNTRTCGGLGLYYSYENQICGFYSHRTNLITTVLFDVHDGYYLVMRWLSVIWWWGIRLVHLMVHQILFHNKCIICCFLLIMFVISVPLEWTSSPSFWSITTS